MIVVLNVLFYTRKNCKLCEEAYALLTVLQNEYEFTIEERDIETNDEWLEEYQLIIPVIHINDTILNCNMIDFVQLEQALRQKSRH